jgi:hypothetical protein
MTQSLKKNNKLIIKKKKKKKERRGGETLEIFMRFNGDITNN